jgi:hypothetical protein
MEASFSKATGNKTLEFGGGSPFNDLTRYKMESFYFYLIETKCTDLGFCAPDDHPHSFREGEESQEKRPTLDLLKLRWLRAAAISLIAIENFVIADEFGQIYSLSNL